MIIYDHMTVLRNPPTSVIRQINKKPFLLQVFVIVLLFFLFWVVLAVWLDVFLFSRTSQFRKVPEGFRKLFWKLNKHCYWGSRFLRVPEVFRKFPEGVPEAMFCWKHRKQFVLCHFVLVHLRVHLRAPASV